MVIVLNTDASANNIGQITGLPIAWDANALAFANAASATFDGLTEVKKVAFNRFIKGLKTNGIWGSITNAFIPIFGQTDGGRNIKSPSSNINLPSANATYNNLGVQFSLAWASGITLPVANEIHFGAYQTSANAAATTKVSVAQSAGALWIGRQVTSGGLAGLLVASSYTRVEIPNHTGSTGPIIATVSNAASVTSVMVDSEYAFVTQNYSVSTPASFILGGHTNNSALVYANCKHGYFTFGAPLTEAKMAIYAELQTTLMNALTV